MRIKIIDKAGNSIDFEDVTDFRVNSLRVIVISIAGRFIYPFSDIDSIEIKP